MDPASFSGLGLNPFSVILLTAIATLTAAIKILYTNHTNALKEEKTSKESLLKEVTSAKELAETKSAKEMAELELRMTQQREQWHTETRNELKDVKDQLHATRAELNERDKAIINLSSQILVFEERLKRFNTCAILTCPHKTA